MNPQIRSAGPSALKVLTSHSSFSVLDALAPAFEQAGGRQYAVEADSARTMLARIKAGETADVAVLGKAAVDEMAELGIVVAGSRRPFARARVGVAVRAGAPRPDISSVEAFKRSMLNASSIAHTVHGASGMYVPVLMERLGIAEQTKPKTVTRPGGYIARVVAAGEAEIAIQQIVELLAVPGVDLVGPLPDEIQKVFETMAGIFTASRQQAEAEALLKFLLAPANAAVFKEKGLEYVGKQA
ncbi:MAG: substrate-binding domain-containing protein [Betaproteobacteria bacterium]|nr:substrate-binding domain-containing protein [Betaproteobacteria bacterium]